MNSLFIKSLNEREFYLNVSRGTFLSYPLMGIGAGQFIPNMLNLTGIQDWQFQPVHNVFLLILNEYGIFILFAFIFFIFKLLRTKCSTWNILQKNKITKNVPPARNATSQTMAQENYQQQQNVPRGTFSEDAIKNKMFHPSTNVPRGTLYGAGVEHFIKSKNTLLSYFKAILLSFTFIMLFDHYLWDIQQGQIMLWLVFGFIASRAGK